MLCLGLLPSLYDVNCWTLLLGPQKSLRPQITKETRKFETHREGPLFNGGDKMLAFLPRWLEVDFVNDLVTILLSVRQTSSKFSRMIILDSPLLQPLPNLRGHVPCTV